MTSDWQSMKTAPKDGSRIKAKNSAGDEIFVQWRDHSNMPSDNPCGWIDDHGFIRWPDSWFPEQGSKL